MSEKMEEYTCYECGAVMEMADEEVLEVLRILEQATEVAKEAK